jgi:hypothetical protein
LGGSGLLRQYQTFALPLFGELPKGATGAILRAMRILKAALIAWVCLSVPVSLGAFAWAVSLFFHNGPLWLFALITVSWITTFLSIALLIDTTRKEAGLPPL